MVFIVDSLFSAALIRDGVSATPSLAPLASPPHEGEVSLFSPSVRGRAADGGRGSVTRHLGVGHPAFIALAHMKYLSVKAKPRSLSGRDIRHRSSGNGTETFEIETCALPGSYFGLGSSGCWHVFKIVSTFISARRSRYIPAREWRETKCMFPPSSTTTLLKKLIGAAMSRMERPYFASSIAKPSYGFL